jgi:hypothetical protein
MQRTVQVDGCCAVAMVDAVLNLHPSQRVGWLVLAGVTYHLPTAVTIRAGGVVQVEFDGLAL